MHRSELLLEWDLNIWGRIISSFIWSRGKYKLCIIGSRCFDAIHSRHVAMHRSYTHTVHTSLGKVIGLPRAIDVNDQLPYFIDC